MSARWIGVGASAAADSRQAGAEAREAALDGDPDLFMVFASAGHDLPQLLAGIDAGDTPLVGCSTAGEIATHGPHDHSVVVMALGGFAIATALATDVSPRLREAG